MRFLYPELPPKKRFLKILEEHILPGLQKDGFELLRSGPSLKKTEGSFEWFVNFQATKWNSGNIICRYNPYFTVKNSDYRKYLKANPKLARGSGTEGYVGTTSGVQHWDKTTFSADGTRAYFLENNDFAKFDNYQLVDKTIKNIRTVGVRYFKMMSDLDSIKKFYMTNKQRKDAPMLIDLCYVLNRKSDIKSIFDWFDSIEKEVPDSLAKEMAIRRRKWLKK